MESRKRRNLLFSRHWLSSATMRVYLVLMLGGASVLVTESLLVNIQAQISLDTTKIAFCSTREGKN